MQMPGDIQPIQWTPERLVLLDQTRLPDEERWLRLTTVDAVAEAIRQLRVRGAPAIGIAAAAGMALAAREAAVAGEEPLPRLEDAARVLGATRPTAVNLRWALDGALRQVADQRDPAEVAATLDSFVADLLDEQRRVDMAMAGLGSTLLPANARVLTHCNTGPLATGGYGTALGLIRAAADDRGVALVYACETRPLLQGARLTTWELQRLGIPCRLIPDSAAAAVMARESIDAVVVGADRIVANGDVANKIGTYQLAIAARHHQVPFIVVAPWSTFDPGLSSGAEIPIEERSPGEVLGFGGVRTSPAGMDALNLAFDVTPAELITAIVTERGVLAPPFDEAIAALAKEPGRPNDAKTPEREIGAAGVTGAAPEFDQGGN